MDLEFLVWKLFRLFRKLHIQGLLRFIWTTWNFNDYFVGFEKTDAVKGIFGEKTEEVLRNLKVKFVLFGYMGVDDVDGQLIVNRRYLNKGNKEDIYLDVIHELVHVRQWLEGKNLFDPHFEYVNRPTEIEAYAYTVNEARKLGWSDSRICQYLETEWLSEKELQQLAKNINVKYK
ncbi:MAG: hypothetical protein N3D85_07255 [Candidatus Bathyarchaeota archaeon]|nr:hypothetical protein [Candidatus Bathyarchaeota archaeon]